jgi:hypothetical protein
MTAAGVIGAGAGAEAANARSTGSTVAIAPPPTPPPTPNPDRDPAIANLIARNGGATRSADTIGAGAGAAKDDAAAATVVKGTAVSDAQLAQNPALAAMAAMVARDQVKAAWGDGAASNGQSEAASLTPAGRARAGSATPSTSRRRPRCKPPPAAAANKAGPISSPTSRLCVRSPRWRLRCRPRRRPRRGSAGGTSRLLARPGRTPGQLKAAGAACPSTAVERR